MKMLLAQAPPAGFTNLPVQPVTCRVVTDVAAASELTQAWSDLLRRSARRELTHTPDWLLTWWHVFGPLEQRELRLGVFQEGARLVGLAPLLRRRHWYRHWLPFRRLEFLGSGERIGEGICSNHLSIVAERGAEELVARRLVEAMVEGAFGAWDEIVMPMMSADTVWPELLVEEFRTAGYRAEITRTAGAPYLPLPATWNAYLHGHSSNNRRNIERSIKRFDQSAGAMELECISSFADLERGKDVLIQLHHDRWASDHQAGVFEALHFRDFHNRLMQLLAARDMLELLILRVGGVPMAALYSMVWDNKVYAYQSGRRMDVRANAHFGDLLFSLAIRRAIEHGRREFDLLADEAVYKRHITPHTRALLQVRAARPRLAEAIRRLGMSCLARLRR